MNVRIRRDTMHCVSIYDETPTLQCANRREVALQRLIKTTNGY